MKELRILEIIGRNALFSAICPGYKNRYIYL